MTEKWVPVSGWEGFYDESPHYPHGWRFCAWKSKRTKVPAMADFCRNGHEYTPENTATRVDGYRRCRECTRQSHIREQARKRGNTSLKYVNRRPSIELTAERRETVARMTRRGYTAPQIADHLGICTRVVQRMRTATGVRGPQANPMTPHELEMARMLLEDGASYGEVSRTLGRAHCTIKKHFPDMGWKPGQGVELRWANEQLKKIGA